MKKLIKIFSIVIMLFTFTQCDLFENLDNSTECGVELELIEKNFRVYATVYKDGEPYEGPIEIEIHKVYCDGTIKGVFKEDRETNSDGKANPINYYTYKLANKHDKVVVTIGSTLDNEGRWYQETKEYYYKDALEYYTSVDVNIGIYR